MFSANHQATLVGHYHTGYTLLRWHSYSGCPPASVDTRQSALDGRLDRSSYVVTLEVITALTEAGHNAADAEKEAAVPHPMVSHTIASTSLEGSQLSPRKGTVLKCRRGELLS